MLKKGIIFQYLIKQFINIAFLGPKKLINSEYYYKNSISVPIYYNLNYFNQKMIVNEIKNYIHKFKIKKK